MKPEQKTTDVLRLLREATQVYEASKRQRDEATEWIFKRLYERLRTIAKVRFPQKLQGRVSISEVVQEALIDGIDFASRTSENLDSDSFARVLVTILERRIKDALRRNSSDKRDIDREGNNESLGSERSRDDDPTIGMVVDEFAKELAEVFFDEDHEAKRLINILGLLAGVPSKTIREMLTALPVEDEPDGKYIPPTIRTIDRTLAATRNRVRARFNPET